MSRRKRIGKGVPNLAVFLVILAQILGAINIFHSKVTSADGINTREIPEIISGMLNGILSVIHK